MPVYNCAGTAGCQRLISVTTIPGGNPSALAEPAAYASVWTLCSICRSYTCDWCLKKQRNTCKCGAGVRLYSEPERLAVARGGQPVPAVAVEAPPPPTTAVPPLRPLIEGIAQQIDVELAQHGHERARSLATLGATLMVGQGASADIADLPWYMLVGEQFYRWGYFGEGAQFWKGIYQLANANGQGQTDDAMRIIATAGAFQVLSGELTASSPHAVSTAGFVAKVFGPQHPLTVEIHNRLGVGAAPVMPGPPPPAPPPAQTIEESPVVMSPRAPPQSALTADFDPPTKMALWVTLAFIEMAVADGVVADAEYMTWKRTMERLRLPNVWDRFGMMTLRDMLHQGALHQLSIEMAQMPYDARAQLAGILVEFMVADGVIEPAEVQALKRITGWLGVNVNIS